MGTTDKDTQPNELVKIMKKNVYRSKAEPLEALGTRNKRQNVFAAVWGFDIQPCTGATFQQMYNMDDSLTQD